MKKPKELAIAIDKYPPDVVKKWWTNHENITIEECIQNNIIIYTEQELETKVEAAMLNELSIYSTMYQWDQQ